MTGRRLAIALTIAATALAGCLDAPAASPSPTPTREPEPTPRVTTYRLGTTVWYEGLLVHFERATATLDARGGPVEVDVRIENSAAEAADLNAPINLLVDGELVEPTRESRVPTIPAEGAESVLLRYELQGVSSVNDAALQIGTDPLHLGRVPLTPAGGEPAAFEPIALDVGGTGTAGDLRIRLREGLVRWDLPDWSQQLEADVQALTLTYDVTYLGEFTGGFAFTGDNVSLRLPDGSMVAPRRDGHSQSVELIGTGKTVEGLISRFEIPAGMTGRYAFFVRDAGKETGIVFTIGG
jgi:hypothetical protein